MSMSGPYVTNRPWPQPTEAYRQEKYIWSGPIGTRVPMPYRMYRCASSGAWNVLTCLNVTSQAYAHASSLEGVNYEQFWKRLQEKASLGVTLLEGRKSLAMVAHRFQQLTDFVRAVRRLDVAAIYRILKVSPLYRNNRPTRVGDLRSFSSLWLEFTFGWVPLVQDIYSACQVLSQDFGNFKKFKVTTRDSKSYSGGNESASHAMQAECVFTSGATVRVTNPNLNLANQLGLLNPAYVLWDAVPFSFMLDWVAPVGKFLRRLSNGIGLQITRAWKQVSAITRGFVRHQEHGLVPYSARGVDTTRTLGLVTPPSFLSGVKFPQFDPWLAATSLSLFVQQFSGMLTGKGK